MSTTETDEGATDFVLTGDTRLAEAQAALAAAEASGDGHAMGDAHHAISEAGGFDARPRAQAMRGRLELCAFSFRPSPNFGIGFRRN